MINVKTGEIKLDDYEVIFHVDLTLEEFRASDKPPLEIWGGKEHKYSDTYIFNASIDGMNANFSVSFAYTKLVELRFSENTILYDEQKVRQELLDAGKINHERYVAVLNEVTDFTGKIEAKQMEKLNAWLAKTTNSLPPYEYEWGEIISLIDYRGPGKPEIIIKFKKDFPEGMDYKTYYQDRRERMERLEKEMARSRTLAPGEFPPGFSPKER